MNAFVRAFNSSSEQFYRLRFMQSLSQYYQRAPRYILLPQDDCLIRVAGPLQTPWEEGTEIKDLSISGLAFTAPDYLVPKIGEHIKVQFRVPEKSSMACFAQVVRMDPLIHERVLVAVKFENLNQAQLHYLNESITSKYKSIGSKPKKIRILRVGLYILIVVGLIFSLLTLLSIYHLLSHFTFNEIGQVVVAAFK